MNKNIYLSIFALVLAMLAMDAGWLSEKTEKATLYGDTNPVLISKLPAMPENAVMDETIITTTDPTVVPDSKDAIMLKAQKAPIISGEAANLLCQALPKKQGEPAASSH